MSAGDARPAPQTTDRTSTVLATRSETVAATVTSPDPDNGTKVRLNYHPTLMLIIIVSRTFIRLIWIVGPKMGASDKRPLSVIFFHFFLISEILDPPTNCHSTRM